MLGVISIVTILVCAQASPDIVDLVTKQQNVPPRYNTELRIAKDGYYSESHNVVTSDGYVLEMNRIPKGRFQIGTIPPRSKPVVFLMHGLQSSGLAFISLGHRVSLAYILADAGYDVWLGNARGIMNSRRHIWLNPDNKDDQKEFFDYTFEDVAAKDLPSMIDYVLRLTQQDQLNYIGHSQGGTAFLVLNSLKPEFNKKFRSVHLLAGVGYQEYFPNDVLSTFAKSTDLIFAIAIQTGNIELLGPSNNAQNAQECLGYSILCKLGSLIKTVKGIYAALEGVAGASIKQYAHFGQNIRDKEFRRWNYYNPLQNLWTYGSFTPPAYDLKLVTADVTMHYTVGDILLHENDVLNMAEVLPNAKVRRVARDSFSHFDFVTSADSRELVGDYIIQRLNEKNN